MLDLLQESFGTRIELGKLFEKSATDPIACYKGVMRIFGKSDRLTRSGYKFFYEVVQSMERLARQEKIMLKNEPTAEERSAGITDYLKNVGEMATIKSLAKQYSKDTDEILQWKYGKVFGILYADLEESKFQRRYDKVIEQKMKRNRR